MELAPAPGAELSWSQVFLIYVEPELSWSQEILKGVELELSRSHKVLAPLAPFHFGRPIFKNFELRKSILECKGNKNISPWSFKHCFRSFSKHWAILENKRGVIVSPSTKLPDYSHWCVIFLNFRRYLSWKFILRSDFYPFLFLPKKLEPRSWLHLAPPGAGAELEPENFYSPGTGAELEPGKFQSPGAGAEPEPGNLEKFRTLIIYNQPSL